MKKLSTLKNLMTNYKTMFKQYKKVYSFEECLYQNKITLRQAIVTDINSFLQIEEDVYDGKTPWNHTAFLQEMLNNRRSIYISAVAKNEVIAFIGVDFYPLKCEAHITNFAVATPYQGQGLAKFMMKKVMDFCKDEGYKVISLEVNNNNIIAKSLYAKMGFKEGKFLKNYYTETLEDAIEMYVYL